MSGFDPYFDYDDPCEAHIAELHEALTRNTKARERFLEEPNRETFVEIFESWDAMDAIINLVKHEAHTIPVIVHVAGEKRNETNPDNPTQEGVVQRCSQCGSVLSGWTEEMLVFTEEGPRALEEDEIPWWEPGQRVAKTSQQETSMGSGVGMYSLDPQDRDLDKHEMPCVNLAEL